MAGPYSQYSDPSPSQPPSQPNYSEPQPALPYPSAATSVYPGNLPPPVAYPGGRRRRLLAIALLVIAVVAGATTAIVFALNSDTSRVSSGQISESRAKSAIQDYLTAMLKGDTETVARNSLCGLYDALKDHAQDQQVARQMSDNFRRTFSKADVASIDKMVFRSPTQAQVLFTMRVAPVTRGSRERDEQATATLLLQKNDLYVCDYVPRAGSQF